MKLHKRKLLFFISIVISLVFTYFFVLVFAKEFIYKERERLYRIVGPEIQVIVKDVYVCTSDGQSLSKQEGDSYYIVPKEMERIYICGTLENSNYQLVTIYLSKYGDAFFGTSDMLKEGPFIMDVKSTASLKAGVYQADLYIVKGKPAVSVGFKVEK